ncbi:MAG TPA: 4Fe-4S binding protein [Bacteroidia bacterium]|nr:4Fe-4S binding protein [Bacteroidia bacterium]
MKTKINFNDLPGKQVSLTAFDAAQNLMSVICESVLCSACGKLSGKNIFGRTMTYSSSGDVSYSIGFTSTGLRAGIVLNSLEISSNLESISNAVRMHIPLVIFASVKSQHEVNQLSRCGAVVLSANTTQEVLDLLLLSFRIAELSLIPVVVCIEETEVNREENILFPEKEIIKSIAGSPDNYISSPTPSQQIIFGKQRKRIPGWFNTDHPVSLGASKQLREAGLESAAQEEYFYSHLDAIAEESFREFGNVTGRKYDSISLHNYSDAGYLVVSYGSISGQVVKAIDEFRSKKKIKVASARLVQVSPFPSNAFVKILQGKKTVTVLEQSVAVINNSELFNEISSCPGAKQSTIFSGIYAEIPSAGSLHEVILNMLPEGKAKSKFRIDIDFTRPDSDFPKHQVLLQAIAREYPDAQLKTIAHPARMKTQPVSRDIPIHIRKFRDLGPAYSKLSRFFDDTASFFITHPEELVADPFQAIPVMPPSTAGFNSGKDIKFYVPAFNPDNCTGCGDCFLHCPHSAINPLVIGIENLIKAGIAISNAGGNKITQLTPLVKNLSKNIHEVIRQKKTVINSVAGFIPEAFENVIVQMNLKDDKLEAAKKDIEAVTAALHDLPVSVTDVFYNDSDNVKKGSGELFTLAIDVNACTACSVCESICDADAINMKEENSDSISTHQRIFSLWEQLPDTRGETISCLLDEKKYNAFSAILLSRHFNLILNGRSEDGSDASKSMTHLITSIAEATLQPKIQEMITLMDELTTGLSQSIHSQLESALPSKDFDSLAKVLSEIKEDRKPFEDIIDKLGQGEHLKLVDTKTLRRKVELAQSLMTLKWLLTEGASGTGRARMGFVLDGTLPWSNSYPWNNFTAPVVIELNGTTPELAKGIAQGQTRQFLDNIKILRRARLEVDGNYEPEINDAQIAALTWNDLSEKEKNLVPPVIIIGSKAKLAGKDLDSLVSMLNCNLPLKAIVIDDVAPAINNSAAEIISGIGVLLPVLALNHACVIKSSLASPQHLFTGLHDAISSSKPALAWVFAPSESKHIIPPGSFPKLYTLSLNSRAFPVFSFNPEREGKILSSKIEMDENPQNNSAWTEIEFSYKEEGEIKIVPYSITWADWAFTLNTWRELFIPYDDVMGKAVPVAEFILLSQSERAGKCPVIFRVDNNEALKKYKAAEEVIAAVEACAVAWQLLREVSGELTEFPDKLHRKIEDELSEQYELKMSELSYEYENKISNLEAEHLQRIRIKLKEKLIMLAQQANGK